MSLRFGLLTLGLLSVVGTAAGRAQGQSAYGQTSRQTPPAAAYQTTNPYQTTTGRNNAALNFYGRPKSMQFAQQSRAMPLPPPQSAGGKAMPKPFSGVQQASSISPYLALDNVETSNSLPNYFLFVKPQLDFQARLRAQNAQNWRQQQQMNAAAGRPTSDAAATGHTTQFMNSGGYYPGLR